LYEVAVGKEVATVAWSAMNSARHFHHVPYRRN